MLNLHKITDIFLWLSLLLIIFIIVQNILASKPNNRLYIKLLTTQFSNICQEYYVKYCYDSNKKLK